MYTLCCINYNGLNVVVLYVILLWNLPSSQNFTLNILKILWYFYSFLSKQYHNKRVLIKEFFFFFKFVCWFLASNPFCLNNEWMVFQAMILHCKATLDRLTTWANEMKFVMNHAPDAGSIAWPIDQQPNGLPQMPLSFEYKYVITNLPGWWRSTNTDHWWWYSWAHQSHQTVQLSSSWCLYEAEKHTVKVKVCL